MQLLESKVQERSFIEKSGGSVFQDASFGFMPAFMDINTSETHLASYEDGELAAIHILDGLPKKWVSVWDTQGKAQSLQLGVVAGFMRSGEFYSLSEIMNKLCDA